LREGLELLREDKARRVGGDEAASREHQVSLVVDLGDDRLAGP
jgi:hypothetical protein